MKYILIDPPRYGRQAGSQSCVLNTKPWDGSGRRRWANACFFLVADMMPSLPWSRQSSANSSCMLFQHPNIHKEEACRVFSHPLLIFLLDF
jgi:hypothetical protein